MARMARRTAYLLGTLAGAALSAQGVAVSLRPAATPIAALSCFSVTGSEPSAGAPPPLLVEGLGTSGIVPDTSNEEARRWFDQGVRLIWAFDEAEAIRSFTQAQRLDPKCALCFWGEAWARGPTINLQPRTEELAAASAAAARAAALGARLSDHDRGLIAAMQVRAAGGQEFRNKPYVKAIAKLAAAYPADDAIAVIAADAEMMVKSDGIKPGSNAQRLLETVLRRNPDHSGAIHMYIHLNDWTDSQQLAVPYAERLGRVAPAASHLVHMPSHSFYGVGRYEDAARVNVAAIAADDAYVARVKPPASDYRTGLFAHDSHFAIESALIRGDGKTALMVSDIYRKRYPEAQDDQRLRFMRSVTWYAAGRHSDVGEVLAAPEPVTALMRAMRHYARGEALARKGDAHAVAAEAAAIAGLRDGLEGRALGSKGAEALAAIAQHVLEGRSAMLAGNPSAAAKAYRAAMGTQESAGFGGDPPPFWYSVRRSLAAATLAAGDAEGAKRQLAASLAKWPGDPLALYLLSKAEAKLGQQADSAAHLARAKGLWAGNVESIPLALI
jgi:tetratricopeptide (TPR) repeat protein